MNWPDTQRLALDDTAGVLTITLNRPQLKNAMNLDMVKELMAVFEALKNSKIRIVVLKGRGGNFCAGGDVKDMALAANQGSMVKLNRAFGHMIECADTLPQVMICVLEGAVLGGGLGLACVSDIAMTTASAQFGMPETSLGLIPAQIAPFVVKRIGLTHTRRLALTAARFGGEEARSLGLVQYCCADKGELEDCLAEQITRIKTCAPKANALTKALLHKVGTVPIDTLLDEAAQDFARSLCGDEAQEGIRAFQEKRKPGWAHG